MIAWPDLQPLLAARPLIFCFDDLSVIFDNIGQAVARQNALPEVISLEAIGIGWIAGTVVPALVEREKP